MSEIHIDLAEQDPNIPEKGPGRCPNHPEVDLEGGYGLAGGGMGVYMYCPVCGYIDSKVQDPSE